MSEYQEFTGKSVEEALKLARESFDVGLDDLDFEILTPGSRGVLGMGAEPARIIAAPRSALGGAAPRRDAAAQTPLPTPPPRESYGDREDRGDRGGRGRYNDRGRDRDRGRGRRDYGSSDTGSAAPTATEGEAPTGAPAASSSGSRDRGDRGRGRYGDRDRGRSDNNRDRSGAALSAGEQDEVRASRARL